MSCVSFLCMFARLVLCDNGVFVNDGVEDNIDAFFEKENYKIVNLPFLSVAEIDAALIKIQENVDGYIDYFCKQIPIYIRQKIKDSTDKNLPKDFNIYTMSPTKYLISDYYIKSLQNELEIFYHDKINQLQSIIIFHYNNLALDVPAFRGIFNVTFFKDRFYDDDTRYSVILHFLKNAAKIAAEKTSVSNDFINYFKDNVDSRFNKMNNMLKDRVRFMIKTLQKNMRITKKKNENVFSVLYVGDYVEKKPLRLNKSDVLFGLEKMNDNLYIGSQLLETKPYENVLNFTKTEFIYIIDSSKLLNTDERLKLIALSKTKITDNIQSFYNDMIKTLETIKNDYESLNKIVLKLGDDRLATLKQNFDFFNDYIWSTIDDSTLLVENIIEEISDKIIIKKEIISDKDLKEYVSKVTNRFNRVINVLIIKFNRLRTNFYQFYNFVESKTDVDDMCINGLEIASTEVLNKINGVYDYIHDIWSRKILYYEALVNSYPLMLFIRKYGNLSGLTYINTYNKNSHNIGNIEKSICDNFEYLIEAFSKTGRFFLSIFETNYLNEIPNCKQLFSKRLSTLMNYYKSRIESINKKLILYNSWPSIKKTLFFKIDFSVSALNVITYAFEPHQHALELYKKFYQHKNGNKQIKNNYELIKYIKDKNIINDNTKNTNIIDNNIKTGDGAMNKKANDSINSNGQNDAPQSASSNENNKSVSKDQDYILIGVIGLFVLVLFAIVIAILVKRR